MMGKTVLGIDIGGTNTVWGLVASGGQILRRGQISTRGYDDVASYIHQLYTSIHQALGPDEFNRVEAIGVGAPNGNFFTGQIEFAPNLEWKGIIPLQALLVEQFQKQVRLTNDANAAALGEMQFGAAIGMRDFILVTLGTGVGSGFVANGQLVYGHDGFAGELGHVIAIRNGRACGCGRNGCLEAYTSATGVVRTALELINELPHSTTLKKEGLSAKKIAQAAQHGDAVAKRVFEITGEILGQSLADAVAITSPEAIILFGGLVQAGDLIMQPLREAFEANLLSIYKHKVRILLSALPESDAAILGAAGLAAS
ncbi:MAG: ROK family protein [Chitinophagaceae bacterium]|nr:ROK family protein [Chitinophagaceae bacterium]